ncbi:hypothetical protein VTK73DRAFT_5289 [Phialemonium thermophilum]|uniref:Uncharacterized protein n=1 Tax=Phialemonium thermophilum TaxID=223376 RepID=A0ABR3V339_9PEZI
MLLRRLILVAGDPSVQPPPTPKQTPALSSPLVLETPQIPSDSHDDPRDPFGESSGWTPRFAEEYSVFNATPGNLRADANRHYHHHHHHHSSSVESSSALWSPFPPPSSAGHKRLHSSGEISLPADPLGAYSSNNNNNSNNNVSPTSPAIPAWPTPESATDLQDERKKAPKRLSPKKKRPRCDTRVRGTQRPPEQYDNHNHNHNSNNDDDEATQTATPPPSAQKEKRKRSLAPRLDTNAMQSDHGFGHVDFGTSSHQQHQQQPDDMPAFLSTPSDLFGYPLSAPAGPAASFWDPDPSCMAGMDIDFGAGGGGGGGGAEVFQNGSVHGQRPMDPVDWSAGPMSFLQPDGALQQHNQENIQPSRGPQEMEPKNLAPADGNTSSSADAGVFIRACSSAGRRPPASRRRPWGTT